MSVSLDYDLTSLTVAGAKLAKFAQLDYEQLLNVIGAIAESQTKRRIQDEKTSPDGKPWPERKTGGTNPLLQKEGHLLDSIQYIIDVHAKKVSTGSNVEYARLHNEGGDIVPLNKHALAFKIGDKLILAKKVTMPQRQYLGFSAENEAEIEAVITGFLADHAARTLNT